MFVMGLLKMYGATTSHKMLMETTKLDATMFAIPLECIAKLIAWTTHFFKSLSYLQPWYFRPCQIQACQNVHNRQSTDKLVTV